MVVMIVSLQCNGKNNAVVKGGGVTKGIVKYGGVGKSGDWERTMPTLYLCLASVDNTDILTKVVVSLGHTEVFIVIVTRVWQVRGR